MLDFVQRQVELRKGGARLPLLFPSSNASMRAQG
jgi:hypothetical protein